MTPGFPRIQIKAWDISHHHIYLAYWGRDTEIEWGQSLNGRWGIFSPWLVKENAIRYYSSDGSYVEYSPTTIAFGNPPLRVPKAIGKTAGEIRSVSKFGFNSGAFQTALTLELTSISEIPGIESRGTTYFRIATNTYLRRYATATVKVVVLATMYQLYQCFNTPIPETVPLPGLP
ncbi:MAG: hypothetical protein RBT75_10330 [Anaerolineae bacterium]|jgi:hypothetical protein|nr:hypothetical protein [Anaerolineae bacterium]